MNRQRCSPSGPPSLESPILTIIVPLYNEGKYVRELLNSIRRQSLSLLRVAVVDNASSDNTWSEVVSAIKGDIRFEAIRRPKNIGAVANVALALRGCDTPYVSIIGGHDLLHPEWARSLVSTLNSERECVLAYPSTLWIDDFGCPIKRTSGGNFVRKEASGYDRHAACVSQKWAECTAVNGIFRTSVFDTFWFPKCKGPDHILLARASYLGKILHVNQALYFRREFQRVSNYNSRIRGDAIAIPTTHTTGTLAAHFVDICIIASRPKDALANLPNLVVSLKRGYGLRNCLKASIYFLTAVPWVFWFSAAAFFSLLRRRGS